MARTESAYDVAETFLAAGWRVERVRISAANGSSRQGWEWTSPAGEVSRVIGLWEAGPTKPKKVKLPPTWHMKFVQLSPRNETFLVGTLPVPCPACGEPYPERSLVPYRGERCCLGCLLAAKRRAEREEYRRATLAPRAWSYMESQSSLARTNCPEVMP